MRVLYEKNVGMMSLGVACEVMVSALETQTNSICRWQVQNWSNRLTKFNALVENRKKLTVDEVVVGRFVASQFGSKESLWRDE